MKRTKTKSLALISILLAFLLVSSFSLSAGTYYLFPNNLDHAYDGDYNTSANIFYEGDYIIYDLEDLGISPGTNILLTMNAADGDQNTVKVQSLDEEQQVIPDTTKDIFIVGFKGAYPYIVSSQAYYLKINGISGDALYIYEIQEDTSPPGPPRFLDANNLDHAYDGSYNTSANIFSEGGYIIYDLDDLGFVVETDIVFVMNASEGEDNVVMVKSLDSDFETVQGSEGNIDILGFKGSYGYTIPANASYLKIYGIPGDALYVYEIEEDTSLPGSALFWDANNLDHAYDGSYNTSANIFSEGGYIIYDLDDLGFVVETDIVFVMNASEGEGNVVTVKSLDSDFETVQGSEENINILGFKGSYGYTIPANSSYLKIYGIFDDALYVYEIEEDTSPPGPPRFLDANNLDHAYDGSYNTSANIFSENGYIIYDLDDLGFEDDICIHFSMNTRDGEMGTVNVSALDDSFDIVQESNTEFSVLGFKNFYSYHLPQGTRYLKIEGVFENHLYIYEIIQCPYANIPAPEKGFVSFADNEDRSGTLSLQIRSKCDIGIKNLALEDIEVYLPLVGTWTNLSDLDKGGYWSISLDELGDGSYDVLLTRDGSVPYSRNWIVKVNGVELGTVDILISIPSWTGTWDMIFTMNGIEYSGEMVLVQSGGYVTGNYNYGSNVGTITGSIDGFLLTGISTEGGYDFPFEFTLSPYGDSFTGTWYESEDDLEPAGEWNGTRS